jgi:hypothetical protein
MGKDQERDKDQAATTKPDSDKKLTDLTADKKDKEVKGGGGGSVGSSSGGDVHRES